MAAWYNPPVQHKRETWNGTPDVTTVSPPDSVRLVERVTTIEVCPNLARCNRADRRTMEALAKKYGWELKANQGD